MQAHTRLYFDHFGIDYDYTGWHEFIPCEYCKIKPSVDIHHIVFRSQGGKDEALNLIALCRSCHDLAHKEKIPKTELLEITKNR